jgi:hypothetical protein
MDFALIGGRGCVDSPPMAMATGTTSSKHSAAPSSKHSTAPERSLHQRMDALARANQIRTKRAQLKRDLKSGRLSIRVLLQKPPEYVETAKVFDMLLAVPKYGRVKVNKILVHCRISPSKTIGGLSERQRSELVSLLRH